MAKKCFGEKHACKFMSCAFFQQTSQNLVFQNDLKSDLPNQTSGGFCVHDKNPSHQLCTATGAMPSCDAVNDINCIWVNWHAPGWEDRHMETLLLILDFFGLMTWNLTQDVELPSGAVMPQSVLNVLLLKMLFENLKQLLFMQWIVAHNRQVSALPCAKMQSGTEQTVKFSMQVASNQCNLGHVHFFSKPVRIWFFRMI